MKKILVLSSTLGYDDVRILKEIKSLQNYGYSILVIGQTINKKQAGEYLLDGINYHIIYMDQDLEYPNLINKIKKSWIYKNNAIIKIILNTLNIFYGIPKYNIGKIIYYKFIFQIFEISVSKYVNDKNIKFDLIHCHDFYTLPAAHLLSINHNTPVIYDSHEYYRDYGGYSEKITKYWVKILENIYLSRVHVVTVSEKIGSLLKDNTKTLSVTIIKNSPSIYLNKSNSDIRSKLGLRSDSHLFIYVGKFSYHMENGSDLVFEMMQNEKDLHFAVIGPRDHTSDSEIINQAIKREIQNRVHLMEPVSYEEVVDFIRSADAGISLFKINNLSYKYCLPNKFFEMGFANVPVIYRSGLSEIDRIAKKYNYGYELKDQTSTGLANALISIHEDPSSYRMSNEKHEDFKMRFSWEIQVEKLNDLYKKLLAS